MQTKVEDKLLNSLKELERIMIKKDLVSAMEMDGDCTIQVFEYTEREYKEKLDKLIECALEARESKSELVNPGSLGF